MNELEIQNSPEGKLKSENAALKQELDIIKSELRSRVYLHNTLSEWVVKLLNKEAAREKVLRNIVNVLGPTVPTCLKNHPGCYEEWAEALKIVQEAVK